MVAQLPADLYRCRVEQLGHQLRQASDSVALEVPLSRHGDIPTHGYQPRPLRQR